MWKLKIVDDPTKHKHPKVIHTYPIPRGGGLAIFLSFLFTTLIFLPIDKHILGIIGGAIVITVVGLLDDKFDLSPYLRFVIQFIAASIPVISGIGIAFLTNPMGGIIDLSNPRVNFSLFGQAHSIWILSDLFALFLIVYMMNAINFGAKGVDGQLSGVMVISAFILAILSLRFSTDLTQWPVIILSAITGGAFLGFLPWHIFPQKIMPSFSGSNLGGYLLAVLSILSTSKVGVLLVVLAVPLIDTGYVIIRRILSGKSPFWGDRGHLHHRLLDNGWSKRKVSYFYWVITLVLGIVALNLNAQTKLYTMIGVSVFVGGLILWLTYRPKSSRQ
jgi:UDP-GlcNAc:undecaprenyl-phosphate GlcNAc-1-phosphate transferase